MAKAKNVLSEDKEIKKLLESLHKAVQLMNSTIRDTTSVNRDLLKAMALIESGFASSKEDAEDLIEQVSGGLQITDELTKKWAANRKIAKGDLDDILKKFRELETLNEDEIENAKDYLDLLKDRDDYLEDELDLSKQLFKSHADILKIVKANKNALAGASSELDKKLEKLVSRGVDFSAMFDDTKSSLVNVENLVGKIKADMEGMVANVSGQFVNVDLNFNPLSGQLDEEIAKVMKSVELEKNARVDGLMEFFKENKKLQTSMARNLAAELGGIDVKIDVDTGQFITSNGILRKGTEEFNLMAEKLDDLVSKSGLVDQLSSSFKEVADLVRLGSDLTEEQKKRYDELLNPMGISTKMLVRQVALRQSELNLIHGSIQEEKEKHRLAGKYLNQLQSAESLVMKIGSGFDYINALMPSGIGEFLGLAKVSNALMESHRKGVQAFSEGMQNSASHAEAMGSYLKAFKPALSLALNPLMLMATAAILLFKFVEGITDKYKQMATEMKISLGQSKGLLQVQLDTLTSQKNQFATLKDIQDVQSAMIGSSGKVFDLTNKDAKELSIQLVEVGKYFGYGNEQAVELQKTFERLGADKKLALILQRNMGHMAEMAGLSPQIISQDLVDSADMVATYFAGMPDKAASAAIQVRRMGMSLQQAGSIAQKMLDLEGFMTDMYELQSMTGGGIDFSEAFDKGLMGDIEGMTESIMKNIGGTEKFAKMDYLQRTKIAKTLGMSNDELLKSVTLHEKMSGLDDKTKAALEANKDRLGDITMLSQEDLQNRLQQLQSTDRLGVAWDKIKGVLVNSLLPLVEAFADGIDAISPVLDIVIMAFKGIGIVIKLLAPLIKGILAPFKWISEGLSQVTGGADEFGESIKKIQPFLDAVGKGLYYIGAGIGILFAPKIFMGMLNGLKGLISHIPIIGKLFGSADKSAKDTAASSAESVREMASSVQSSMSSMVDSIGSTMTGIATSIKETFNSITSGAQTVSDKASKVSSEVAGSLSKDASVVSSAAVKMNAEVASSVAKTTSNVSASTSKMAADVQTSVAKTQSVVKKGGTLGFINADSAKKGFGTIGDIASKTFAIMAIRSATSFFTMRKEGEEQTSAMTDNMSGMMDMAFMGAGTMLSGYLSEGIEKVFSKKIEKHIEGKLENPIKKLSGAFGKVGTAGEQTFDGLESKGKGVFGRIVDFAKKILPGSTTSVSGTFDNLADQGKQVLKPIEQVQDVISQTKSISEKTVQSTTRSKKINIPSPSEPIQDVAKKTGSSFSSFTNILKSVWDGIKTVLTNIVKFVSSSMKELSSGIGTAIKNLLKGIGDGLSSFKGSALKGAATLVILSGALWITSKAVQNFTSVKWEDLAKAGAAIGGLAVVALALGSASAQMIIGAVAIALLGASLIPAAYALNMFADIKWPSLAKAGVALVGLGIAGAAIGSFLPLMLLGAIGIAALGASLLPLAASLAIATPGLEAFGNVIEKSFKGLGIVIAATASGISQVFETLGNIDVVRLFSIGPALASIGVGLAAMSAGAVSSGISKLFGGDAIKDLERLGNLAEPLYIVQKVLVGLNDALFVLAETLANLDLSGIEKLKDLPKIGIDSVVKQKVEPIVQNYQGVQQDSTQVKISPIQSQVPKVSTPRKEAMAQDKLLNTKSSSTSESGMTMERTASTQVGFNPYQVNNQREDTYEEDTIPDNQETNMLLKKLIYLFELSLKKDLVVQMDGQRVGNIVNKLNNKA